MEYESELIACPYYLENTTKFQNVTHQIRCEGIDSVGKICLFFKSDKGKKEHRETFCYSIKAYHQCPVAKVLDERWADK